MMQYQTGTSLLEDTVRNPRTEFPRSELLHFLQDAQDFAPVRGRFPGVRRIVGTPRLGRLAVVAVMAMVLTNFRWQRNLPTRFLVSSVIRMITITALFHPARHCRRRHARRLGSDSLGRSRRRNRGRDFGARRIARRVLENAVEIADLHRMLLHHGRQGSGELIDFPRSDTP